MTKDNAIRPYRIGAPQFLVGLAAVVALAGAIAFILKVVGVF